VEIQFTQILIAFRVRPRAGGWVLLARILPSKNRQLTSTKQLIIEGLYVEDLGMLKDHECNRLVPRRGEWTQSCT